MRKLRQRDNIKKTVKKLSGEDFTVGKSDKTTKPIIENKIKR